MLWDAKMRDYVRSAAQNLHGLELVQSIFFKSEALVGEANMRDLVLTMLMAATRCRNSQTVQWLLKMKPDYVSSKDRGGYTLLSWAVYSCNLDLAKWLVNVAGADIAAVDELGQTLLIEAASGVYSQLDMVMLRWLVEDGRVNISHMDNTCNNALWYAAVRGNYDVVLYLLTNAGQSVSDVLWAKVHPLSGYFLYESCGVPSPLLRAMLLSSHPVPDVEIHGQENQRFFARACATATRLRGLLPGWLINKFELLLDSLTKWMSAPIVQILADYSTPSVDEVWSIVSRRNPVRAVRKRKMLAA